MFRYLFTNDLRISSLKESLQEAATLILENQVPSAQEDKSKNNNINTLAFYFNLANKGKCAELARQGKTREVVLNFIKKFQFPNFRTLASYQSSREDEIRLAPMRTILKVLLLMNLLYKKEDSYLTQEEVKHFIFYNDEIAKTTKHDYLRLIDQIKQYRDTGLLPENVDNNSSNHVWNQEDRQMREMLKTLTWSGCVQEVGKQYRIENSHLHNDNKAFIYDILNYNEYWKGEDKESYQQYMEIEDSEKIEYNTVYSDDEYKIAAKKITDYLFIYKNKLSLVSHQQIEEERQNFLNKFSPEKLKEIPDKEILERIFYNQNNKNSMCYELEHQTKYWGGISGGSIFKFGLSKEQSDKWKTGASRNQIVLSSDEALSFAKNILISLIESCELIAFSELNSVSDYELLDNKIKLIFSKYLKDEIAKSYLTENYYKSVWVIKYLSIVFPEKFSSYCKQEFQEHILRCFGIVPSDYCYGRCGQISLIENYAELDYINFYQVHFALFGEVKQFVNIDLSNCKIPIVLKQNNTTASISLGYGLIKSLDFLVIKDQRAVSIENIKNEITKNYPEEIPEKVSLVANELYSFYVFSSNTAFVISESQKVKGFIYNLKPYSFIENNECCHSINGLWSTTLHEYKLSSVAQKKLDFYHIKDSGDLQELYKMFYTNLQDHEYLPIVFETNYKSKFKRNRIIFGAPGTGKSFRLKEEAESLLNEEHEAFERVTFHPDYTYSQFVGSYKPVMDEDGKSIIYNFVPGPFMRVYVEALKNARTENVKPYLLIIEEINRAKVASVFGDIFQLLDRNSKGVSEYEIQASEDIRRYLSKELGGTENDFRKIKIPNNMFIWATMNSADQGVYPMDTAFKRRWDFQYLGIDDNEEKIANIGKFKVNNETYQWNKVRKAINKKLCSQEFRINEDKLMGPFFLSMDVLDSSDEGYVDNDLFVDAFKSKVIMYLYEDAVKHSKYKFFSGCDDSSKYSAVCDAFDKIGMKIFGEDFMSTFYES